MLTVFVASPDALVLPQEGCDKLDLAVRFSDADKCTVFTREFGSQVCVCIFSPYARVRVHALTRESLRRDRLGGLTSPACHACDCTSPFRASFCSMPYGAKIQNPIAFFLVCSQSELSAVTRGCTMAPMTVTESKMPAFAIEAKLVTRADKLPKTKGKRAHEIQLAAQAQLAGVCLI